jgi:CSLREA domain-containing protein
MRTSPAFAPIRLGLIVFVVLAALLLPVNSTLVASAGPAPVSLSTLPSGLSGLRGGPLLNKVLERLWTLGFGTAWRPRPAIASVPAGPAMVYTVNSLGDTGTGAGTTGDLRYCLTQANAAGGANTINFGVTGTITLGSQLTISNSVTIQGPGVSQLTISGNNTVRVFNIGSGSFDVTFADLTIANGLAPVSFFSAQGGGILNNSTGTLNITNCTLSGNTAAMTGANTANTGSGGGIFNASTGNVNVINSMLSGNVALATNAFTNNTSRGGGIYNASTGTVTVTSSTLSNNSGVTNGLATVNSSLGGGIYNHDTGAVNVISSTLSNNAVTSGGAVTSNQSNGGGIYNFGAGTVTVTGSTLSNNSATANGGSNNGNNGNGGGIYNGSTGIVKVTGSTLANNSAAASGNSVTSNSGLGGGIYCGTGTVYVTNSTLASNTVTASGSPATTNSTRGGGIYSPGATLTVTNSTLSSNVASASGSNPSRQGGGMFCVIGTTNVKNSIVAGNTATTNPDVFGTFTSQGYNLIGNNTGGSGFTNGVNNDQAGSAGFPLDPLLGPLQNNGGPTQTMALLNGSPAVDKGAAATDPATGNSITTDQRGSLRPVDHPGIAPATGGDNSDIGAFEIPSSNCPPNLTVNDTGDGADVTPGNGVCANSDGVCTLRAAIQEANALTLCSALTINFGVTGTITLSSTLPVITRDLTINGPGPKASNLIIEGNNTFLLMKADGAGVDLTINLLSFTKGRPNASTAGALEFINSNVLTVTDSEFYGNQGIHTNSDYVIYVANSAGGTLNRSTVRNNATNGIKNDLAPLTVTSSTFSDNNGTAIYNISTGTSVSYSTITNHLVGIWNDASVQAVSATLTNNLLSNNGSFNLRKAPTTFSNTFTSGGYNLIDDDKGNIFLNTIGPGDLLNVASAQPTLAALSDYGGATQTRALLPGSQALNAGMNTGAPATDQRGIARPQQSTVDIGAFESRGFTLTVSGGNNQSTTINTNFALPLSVSVTANGAGEPVDGGLVSFTPPGSGASATVAGTPATISSSIATTGALMANGVNGAYEVAAGAHGTTAVNFALLNTCAMPVINAQPQPLTVCPGTPVTFSLAATGPNLMYQWRKGGNPIDGANSSNYTIPAAAAGDQGSYDIVVANTCGTLTSNPAMLTVNAITAITTPPAQQTKLAGDSVTFSVAAQGANLSYQWRKGGNSIGGATGSTYTINNLSLADAGSYDVIVSGTCGVQTSAAATLLVNCPSLTVNPATLPNASVGASYNQTISATGGNAPYTFTVTGGALPGGLTLSPQGQLAGTLNVGGSFTFTISAQDAAGCTSARAYTFATNAPPGLSPIPLSRAAGSNGAAFTIATVSDAETAVNQLQFMLSSDGTNFGPTATLNDVTVTLNGINATGQVTALVTTTCAASTAAFTLKVTDAAGVSTTSPWTVTVPVNTPPVLNYSAQTVALGQALTVNPISGPSDNGTLTSLVLHSVTPALGGVSVNNTSGVVTISNAAAAGNYSVIIRATDNCGAQTDATITLNITSCPTISLTPATLPNGIQGTEYNQTLTGAPAGTTYSFAVTTGSLPPGLTLASNGTLSGTPSAPGNYAFGITATGWGACTRAQSFNLLITGTCATISINPATLPAGTIGTAYDQTLTAMGGTAPYTFNVSQGALPPGLALNTNSGAVTGSPTQSGAYSFRLTATGQGGCTGSRQYVLTIACATPTFNPTTLPNATRNLSYSQTISVSPAGTYTFSLLLGSLPPGFTLSSAGVLSGITNQTGTFNFTVKALSGACQSTKAYALVVSSGTAALAQMADYDGDGRGDFALWSNTSAWRLLLSNGGAQRSAAIQSWGTPGDVPLRGDYDGDGLTDLALFRPANGNWYLKHSSDGSSLVKAWGTAGDVPVPGDYDGDGQTDIAVFRPSEGNWYVLRSSDQQYAVTAWGAGYAPYNDVAVPADYDGDGQTDLAVFRRATGTWLVKRSSDGQYQVKQWGATTDIPVAADYDGDGKTDLAVWRQGVWYIWQSATNAFRIETWGSSAAPYFDQAVPGDYDGDGKADVAVWRAPEQTWYVLCSRYSNVVLQAQGQAGDAPVPGKP